MTSVFNPPKFQAPTQQLPTTNLEATSLDKKKIRKPTGRGDSLLAGLQNALKSRLGE